MVLLAPGTVPAPCWCLSRSRNRGQGRKLWSRNVHFQTNTKKQGLTKGQTTDIYITFSTGLFLLDKHSHWGLHNYTLYCHSEAFCGLCNIWKTLKKHKHMGYAIVELQSIIKLYYEEIPHQENDSLLLSKV